MEAGMQKHVSNTRVFALTAYTVCRDEKGSFRIALTYHYGEKPQWSKPYLTLQLATTAIARKLQAEFLERDKRVSGR
jgi:hypothetical protein